VKDAFESDNVIVFHSFNEFFLRGMHEQFKFYFIFIKSRVEIIACVLNSS
jgi:hypothetical protein